MNKEEIEAILSHIEPGLSSKGLAFKIWNALDYDRYDYDGGELPMFEDILAIAFAYQEREASI
jgi:hypothetical protein